MPGLPEAMEAAAVIFCTVAPPWVTLMPRSSTPIDVFGTKTLIEVKGKLMDTDAVVPVEVPLALSCIVVRVSGIPCVTWSHVAEVSVPACTVDAANRLAAATRDKNNRLRILELSLDRPGAPAALAAKEPEPAYYVAIRARMCYERTQWVAHPTRM